MSICLLYSESQDIQEGIQYVNMPSLFRITRHTGGYMSICLLYSVSQDIQEGICQYAFFFQYHTTCIKRHTGDDVDITLLHFVSHSRICLYIVYTFPYSVFITPQMLVRMSKKKKFLDYTVVHAANL